MKSQSFVVIVMAVLLGMNLLAWIAVFELRDTGKLKVVFFDVGQGDAAFIETPQQNQILIDGGPSARVLEKLGKEMPFWDRTIDLVILTHPEQDHLAGIIEVLRRYRVENILWTGVVRDTPEYAEWQKVLKKEGARVFFAKAGKKITCSCEEPWTLAVLFPLEEMAGKAASDSNNTSIVAKLAYGQTSFLFTGDIEKEAERQLINGGINIDSDVLKIAHHGSKTSSTLDFIAVVSPDIAVISAGKDNRYGHPHPQTLDTLKRYGAKILRTDLDGDITLASDGSNIKLK